ncbi:hypothetical protein [Halarsenatibacter silvermanii]|nr:hypothetical protein [Halarsenatibacter silvermanii]
MSKSPAELQERLKKLEEKFIDYLNEERLEDEAKFVPLIEEHFFYLALEKLRVQNRDELAEKLFTGVNRNFVIQKLGFKRRYIHTESESFVEVGFEEIIRFGNKAMWDDFGLDMGPEIKEMMEGKQNAG